MQKEIKISVENGVGIITLTREKAINALTANMIILIGKTLEDWSKDPAISMVLFEGSGERGFCAGGDVRWTREEIMAGKIQMVSEFFATEYKMNLMIATYPKAIIALTHGVVMGGGIGLAGHAKYRITTQSARFAMPEAAIGLFCDVGVRSIMAGIERHRALMFMFSAQLVSSADAVMLDLADAAIADGDFLAVRKQIIAIGKANDLDKEISKIIRNNKIQAEVASFCQLADRFAHVFKGNDCAEIYSRLEQYANGSSDFSTIATIILGQCPTSNFVHLHALDAAIKQPDIASVLKTDLLLSRYLATRSDFSEGVRAVLVDKDRQPKWSPKNIKQVDKNAIMQLI